MRLAAGCFKLTKCPVLNCTIRIDDTVTGKPIGIGSIMWNLETNNIDNNGIISKMIFYGVG